MKISIIGGGNIGIAIARGIRQSDSQTVISVSRRNVNLIQDLQNINIETTNDNLYCIKESDIIILAVKPHQVDAVLNEIQGFVADQVIISTITGKEINEIRRFLGNEISVYRAMPNTGISQRQSMTCITTDNTEKLSFQKVENLFKLLGEVVFIEESLMDAATVLSSCGIAFALRYVRAATQAGIQIGFSSDTALKIVSQTVKGATTLLLENNTHPESEIDKVTTPMGCTIAGLNEMEHEGFSSALIKGIQNSYMAIDKIRKTN